MASTSRSLQPPSFTVNNYEYWSLTMKALFRGLDVWEMIAKTEPTKLGFSAQSIF